MQSLFRCRSRHATERLSVLRSRLLACATPGEEVDDLAAEELVLRLLCQAFDQEEEVRIAASTRRLVDRIKDFLNASASAPIRLRHIADAVGASTTYVSDAFHRVEGITLREYVQRLRLNRALKELPHATDLSTLAIAAGFSSHSHFTSIFRRTLGLTRSSGTSRTTPGPRASASPGN
jgi:AraC family transcriptional regulator